MKYEIMIRMLFYLLSRRKTTAGELAAHFEISQRTVYRYIDEMTVSGIPVDVTRGANGGICISDAYKLPRGLLSREEYDAAMEAMKAMEMTSEALRSAMEKLSALYKTERRDDALSGNILVDSGAWGSVQRFSDKLSVLERATNEREALEIDYWDRNGGHTHRTILPHLLVYKQNIWYVYAFCRLRGKFRLFKIGRIRTMIKTEERFERIPFRREDIPLNFWTESEKCIEAKFSIAPDVLPFAEEWLGIENVYKKEGGYFADVTLPDDDSLTGKILSAGAGFTVLAPQDLADRIKCEAEKIMAGYRH